MKVLILSDTHRKHDNFEKVIECEKDMDLLIHCGDLEGAEQYVDSSVDCEVKMIAGNTDYFSRLPRELEFELCGKKIWMTHGHHYRVSMDLETLEEEAFSRGVDIVFFGHTHRPVIEEGRVTLVNPGSISYPRQNDKTPTYIVLTIDEEQEFHFELKKIEG